MIYGERFIIACNRLLIKIAHFAQTAQQCLLFQVLLSEPETECVYPDIVNNLEILTDFEENFRRTAFCS